jgi:hypothetical protein
VLACEGILRMVRLCGRVLRGFRGRFSSAYGLLGGD